MNINQDLGSNQLRKLGLLITEASRLEMNIGGYGEAAENQISGNVYIWLEDYPFCLFIDLSGDDDVQACWTNSDNGDEEFISTKDMSLDDLFDWTKALDATVEQ